MFEDASILGGSTVLSGLADGDVLKARNAHSNAQSSVPKASPPCMKDSSGKDGNMEECGGGRGGRDDCLFLPIRTAVII